LGDVAEMRHGRDTSTNNVYTYKNIPTRLSAEDMRALERKHKDTQEEFDKEYDFSIPFISALLQMVGLQNTSYTEVNDGSAEATTAGISGFAISLFGALTGNIRAIGLGFLVFGAATWFLNRNNDKGRVEAGVMDDYQAFQDKAQQVHEKAIQYNAIVEKLANCGNLDLMNNPDSRAYKLEQEVIKGRTTLDEMYGNLTSFIRKGHNLLKQDAQTPDPEALKAEQAKQQAAEAEARKQREAAYAISAAKDKVKKDSLKRVEDERRRAVEAKEIQCTPELYQ
jgi:hypothetical protein